MADKKMPTATELHEALRLSGCAAAGFTAVTAIDDDADHRYRQWLQKGCHAGMDYLERHARLRCHPHSVMPEARTVISIAFRFFRPGRGSLPVAAYALGKEYHKAIKRHLRPFCALLEGSLQARTRICVDSAPLPERYWAVKAGIATIGRNGAAVLPGCGPYAFLCEVLTDAVLCHIPAYFAVATPVPRCNGCNACAVACPTGALMQDGTVDARRCLSYLSIEHKGDLPPDIPMKAGCRFPLLGCDRCIAVCPLGNVGRGAPIIPEQLPHPEIIALTPEKILAMSDEELESLIGGTALRRAGVEGLRRNARMALLQ